MTRGYRTWALPLLASIVLQLTVPPAGAQALGQVEGRIYDTAGNSGSSFRVVLRNLETGAETVSDPASSAGKYTVSVVADQRYELAGAIAPDGTRFPLRDAVSFSVPSDGIRVDVRFSSAEAGPTDRGSAAPAKPARQAPAPPPTPEPPPTPPVQDVVIEAADGPKPWWKRKLVVGAIVVGAFGAFVLVASDNETPASAF